MTDAEIKEMERKYYDYWETSFLEYISKLEDVRIIMDAKYVNHAEIKLNKTKALDNRFFHVLGQLTNYYSIESTCSGFRITLDASDAMKQLLLDFYNSRYPDPTPK